METEQPATGRRLEVPLKGWGAEPSRAVITTTQLAPAARLKRAATIFGLCLLLALIFLPIPLVHLGAVPAAVIAAFVLGGMRLTQGEIFKSAHGNCPFCGTEQDFPLYGRFKLPKSVACNHCHRDLIVERPEGD